MDKEIGFSLNKKLTEQFERTPTYTIPEVSQAEVTGDVLDELIAKKKEIDLSEYEELPASESNQPVESQPVTNNPSNSPLENPTVPTSNPTADSSANNQPATEPVTQQELPPADPERIQKRRQITSKWGVKLYDRLQSLGSIVAYDKMCAPEDKVHRRNALRHLSYRQEASEKELEELQRLDQELDDFNNRRLAFGEQASMDEQDEEELQELMNDLMELNEVDPNPMWVIAIILLRKPVMNISRAFQDKLVYGKSY